MSGVFRAGVGVDEDVVEVDDAEDVEVLAEGVVHEVLEGCRSVGEAEGHDGVFEVAVAASEGGLPFVSRGDPNEVVRAAEIGFGEEPSLGEAIEGFRDEWERVAVLEGKFVESPVVDAQPEGAVLLLDKQDGSASGRGGVSNESLFEVLVDEGLECFQFGSRESVDVLERRA